MKKFIQIICIIAFCISSSLFSYSCPESGNETNSPKKHNYLYEDIQPPPEIPTFEAHTINLDEWEGEKTYTITYSAWLAYNNHVGDYWGYGLEYNGVYIESGSCVACPKIQRGIYITAYAFESDEITDYGSAYVCFDSLDVGEEQTKEVTVTVRENRGRYSGNTAQWVFEITVKRLS